MNPIVYRITLDLAENGVQYVVSGIKAGDTNRKIEVRLKNNGVPYEIEQGTVAQIRADVDGVSHIGMCEINKNVISYLIEPNMVCKEGEIIADIELGQYDENGTFQRFATAEFMFLVYESVVDTGTVPEEYQGSILEAVADATRAATNAWAWAGNAETASYKASNASDKAETAAKNANDAAREAEKQIISSAELTDGYEIEFTKEDGSKLRVPGNVRGPAGEPDYSLVANALKGKKKGNPVALSDVSPLPHEIKVKLTGKPKYTQIHPAGASYFEFKSGDGVYIPIIKEYNEGEGWYYEFEDGSWLSETEVDTDKIYVMDGEPYYASGVGNVNGAVVQKYGKNLVVADKMLNGNLTKDENGVYKISKGSAKAYLFDTPIPANTPFVISYDNLEGQNSNADALFSHSIYFADGTSTGGNWVGGTGFSNSFRVNKAKPVTGFLLTTYNPSADFYASFTGVQLELGTTATAYEPYKEPAPLTADENGNLSILGNGESMTLLAEDGVTMDAEYNRDINKAFAELMEKVGGNA